MKKFAVVALCVTLLSIGVTALAEGTNAGSFARDGIGARALAMGGSFVGVADDSSAGFWNPAGVAYMSGYNLGGMSVVGGQFGIPDIEYYDLSLLAKPIQTGSGSSLGIGITWINHVVSGIPYTGDDGGTFSDTQSLFLVSLAWPFDLGDWSLAVGANLKYYRHTLLTGVGSGLGADLGVLLNGSVGTVPISFGFVSMDTLETTINWRGTQHNPVNYVPWILKGGGSLVLMDGTLRLSADVDFSPAAIHSELDRYPNLDRLHLGVEIIPIEQLALRGGLILWRDGTRQWSAGVGLIPWDGMSLDYAYERQQGGLGGETHILSVDFEFSNLLGALK